MRLDDGIPNMVSEFKSDNTYSPFCQKTAEIWQNIPILPVFDRFFGQKGQFEPIWPLSLDRLNRLEFWGPIWNPLIKAHLLDHQMKGDWKLYFLPSPLPLKFRNLGANEHGVE